MAGRRAIGATAAAFAFLAAAPAAASVDADLHAPASCRTLSVAPATEVVRCDDGLPPSGGTTPNPTGESAITVPAKYGSGAATYAGLPQRAADAVAVAGADPAGNVALDVDVTLPTGEPPAGGFPLLFFMHGCCGGNKAGGGWQAGSIDAAGERWHYSDVWFASRGYAVVTYTARGFVNGQNRGSTGQTQLDSRSYELNDYQHLACQLHAAAASGEFDDVTPASSVRIDPGKVITTGGSYGGGFSWLALTDPAWACTPDTGTSDSMELIASAPKYGWTDLAYTLVPNGLHSQQPGELPRTDGCSTGPRELSGAACPDPAPLGVPKTSIVSALYATGTRPDGDHTTFPPSITEAFSCLQAAYPLDTNPLCANTLATILPEFLRERSAYYQNDFFTGLENGSIDPVPVFNAATFTDPLFPAYENRRMINRLEAAEGGSYPIKSYFGDYQHFVQNKAKEWGDICDAAGNRHVCTIADYAGTPPDFDADPAGLVRTGVTTRLNRFLEFHVDPGGGAAPDLATRPPEVVTASLQVCPENAASLGVPADEPSSDVDTFTAPSFEQLAPNTLSIGYEGSQRTLNRVPANPHAVNADPLGNLIRNGGRCPKETTLAGAGVASYTSEALAGQATMLGSSEARVSFALGGSDQGLQLNARLYDVFPDGSALMVDRGSRRITSAEAAAGAAVLQLHGNGWRFEAGHRVRLELAQDDQPFVRATDVPSSLDISAVRLELPIREGSASIDGAGDCGNRVQGTGRRDRLAGTQFSDRVRGGAGRDQLKGRRGEDCLAGQGGRDLLNGGPGRDELRGGKGNDRLRARDRERDLVSCGKGKRDRARVDRKDEVLKSCERVKGTRRR